MTWFSCSAPSVNERLFRVPQKVTECGRCLKPGKLGDVRHFRLANDDGFGNCVSFFSDQGGKHEPVCGRKKSVGHQAGPCRAAPRPHGNHEEAQSEVEARGEKLARGAVALVARASERVAGAQVKRAERRNQAEPLKRGYATFEALTDDHWNKARGKKHS